MENQIQNTYFHSPSKLLNFEDENALQESMRIRSSDEDENDQMKSSNVLLQSNRQADVQLQSQHQSMPSIQIVDANNNMNVNVKFHDDDDPNLNLKIQQQLFGADNQQSGIASLNIPVQKNQNFMQESGQNLRTIQTQSQNIDQRQFQQQNLHLNNLNPQQMHQDKAKIIPGYTKYFVDEQNQDFNYGSKGVFTEAEIKEAFDTLDMNKNGYITSEEITFFLDVIGEEATEEEIEEMIKLCDGNGNKQVGYDEFRKLIKGESLAPVGQAFPPTINMINQKKLVDLQVQASDQKLTQQQLASNQKNSDMQHNQQQYNFANNNNTTLGNYLTQANTKNQNSTQQQAQSALLNAKLVKQQLVLFQQACKIKDSVFEHLYNQLKGDYEKGAFNQCDYMGFLKFFKQEDNELNKTVFGLFAETDKNCLNLKHFFITQIALQLTISNTQKIQYCFDLLDGEGKGFITAKEFAIMLQMLRFEQVQSKVVLFQKQQIKSDYLFKEKLFDIINKNPSAFFI